MKRFDFRLKSVLVLRQRLLNEAESRYTQAIQKRRDAESKMGLWKQKMNTMNSVVLETRENRISGYQQEAFIGVLKRAKTDLGKIEKEVDRTRKEELREKLAYIEANKNYELLLKLRERQHINHVLDEQFKEQLVMDDLFNARKSVLNAIK
jgi:flagellar export protein FliJ